MGFRLVPVNDRVIVRHLKREEKIGSIYVPDNAKEKPVTGEVLAVGPGTRNRETGVLIPVEQCQVGDIVVFGKYAGTEIEVDNEMLLVLRAPDIYAIMQKITDAAA